MRASLNSLPDELLKLIALVVDGLPHPVTDRRHAAQAQRKTLVACCLVSRRVRRIAQLVLWRCISTSGQLALGAGGGLDRTAPMRVLAQLHNLSTLHLSKVTIDSQGFDSLPQLRDLGLSFVLFVNSLAGSVLDPRRLPSLRNLYADRVWQGVAMRVSLSHLAFELAPQLESLQIHREGALTAAELKQLPPLPVAVVVEAPVNNTPYHRDNTPFAHLELYDVPATSSCSPAAKSWTLQALQRFVFDALTSPTPPHSLTLPHTLLVPTSAYAEALERLCRELGVALRGSESGHFRWEVPRVTGDFARWWAGGMREGEEER